MDSGLSLGHSSCSEDEEEQALLSSSSKSSSTDSISSTCAILIANDPTNNRVRTTRSSSNSSDSSHSHASSNRQSIMANYYTSGFEDVQNWPFSVRYTASPYRKSKLPVVAGSTAPADSSSIPYNNAHANGVGLGLGLAASVNSGSNTNSSVGSNCSNNSVDCNVTASGPTSALRPHQQQHHLQQAQSQAQSQLLHQFQQQQHQQLLHNQQWHSPTTHQYKDDYHHQHQQTHAHVHAHAELANHSNQQGAVMMQPPGSGLPFQLQLNGRASHPSHQQQQQAALFYQAQQHQQHQQQYCSLNQLPTQQQQSFFDASTGGQVFLPPDHNHYGLPAHQRHQQSSHVQNGANNHGNLFFRQSNGNGGQRLTTTTVSGTNPNPQSSSSPLTVDGVILDEGYIEDLKQPPGLAAGNFVLIGGTSTGSSGSSGINSNGASANNPSNVLQHQNQHQQVPVIPQSSTFDYTNYNPYSYVYDSQVLQHQQQQQQLQQQQHHQIPPQFLVQNDGSGRPNFFNPNSTSTPATSSTTTTIIERLRREAAALQAAANAAANNTTAQMAHRVSGNTVVNTSPSLSMKQCSIGAPPRSAGKNGRLSRNSSTGNNSHGSRNSSFENEYEEISDVARYMSMNMAHSPAATPTGNGGLTHPPLPSKLPPPLHFKSFSSTDDILAEVVDVKQKHDRVLDQLNLEVENLLIRSSSEVILDCSNSPASPAAPIPPKVGNHRKGVSDSGLASAKKSAPVPPKTMEDHCYCNLAQSNGQNSAATGATSCINGAGDYCCPHSIDKSRQACNNPQKGSCTFAETCGGLSGPSSSATGVPCSSNYCSCCTASYGGSCSGNGNGSNNDITSGGGGGGSGAAVYYNMTFANNQTNNSALLSSNRKKKLERIFGVSHSNSIDSIPTTTNAKDNKTNYKLRQTQGAGQPPQQCNNDYCDCSFKSVPSGKGKSKSGGGIVKSNSCTSSLGNGNGNCVTTSSQLPPSQSQPKHHRSYSIIPHWKIRDHLMRLPFLRHNSDKLKKSDSNHTFSLSRSLQNSKKYKQQQQQPSAAAVVQGFHSIVTGGSSCPDPQLQQLLLTAAQQRAQSHHHSQLQLFHRDLTGGNKLRKNRNGYIVTSNLGNPVALIGANGGPNRNMAAVKTKSSSMDELRPTVAEEHWYSADSDTDADSLTLLSAQAQQQQAQQQSESADPNANGKDESCCNGDNGNLVGHPHHGFSGNNNANTNSNNGNINSNTMTQSSGVQLRRNSAIENGQVFLRHDIGVIPDVPKAPKFRRGPATATTGLKEKWRESWTQSKTLSKNSLDDDNRLLRWFSLRKNQGGATLNNNMASSNGNGGISPNSSSGQDQHHHNSTMLINQRNSANSTTLQVLSEEDLKRISFTIEDEEGYWPRRTVQPPSLPPLPSDLTAEQLKRRHIVSAICHTENNYVAALQRLVNEYKKPLENSHPAILSHSKISAIFHRLPEILQCHSLFRIALAEYIRKWDTDEKIGDVFVASFSKSLVLDVYSEFINNFGTAMETAKSEARRKSVFAEFLKIKQITAHDRLSLFGLMVKPVQRFPQFILLLQDLLKQTPKDHHDRMSLQLALTQLESLAAMLNERKRESEQYQAFRETIKSISGGKFVMLRSVVDDPSRILLRQDVVTQLEFDSNGGSVAKSKCRKLLLLNDLLICVSLNQSSSNSQSGSHDRNPASSQHNINQSSKNENAWSSTGKGEKSVFKWSFKVQEVEVDDISISPTMSRLVPHSSATANAKLSRSSSLAPVENESQLSKSLLEEMQSLMYDYEVLSRILGLVSTLKTSYEGLNESSIKELMLGIQHQIRCRDEQISYFDSSCLTLLLGNPSNSNREKIVFQMNSPSARNEWIEELRLAQLALDPNNSPGWDIPTESPYPHHKLPLFVRSIPLCRSPTLTTVKCGTFFTHTFVSPTGRSKILDYLWVSCTDGISSHVTAYRSQQNILKEVSSFDLMEEKINDLLFVSGHVWVATESSKILIYDPSDPDQAKGSVNQQTLSASVVKLTLFENVIYAGLGDGSMYVFTQIHDPKEIQPATVLQLGSERITSLFGSRDHVYASCGNAVVTIDIKTHTIERNVVLTHHNGPITHMACSGVGLWIAAGDTGTVCLYHLESLQHLQDVSIAPSVFRTVRDSYRRQKGCHVTCLVAQKGWLWIGTNLGVVLTIPLPRLEGVPIISTGKANVAYHGYYGPVTFLMPLVKQPRVIPIVNTAKTTRTMKSVQISGSTEIISAKELLQQQQLEMLEKAAIIPPAAAAADVANEAEETKAKNTTLTPTTPQNTTFELSPQSSISSGLSGSRDGTGNETLLAPGTTTPRSTSLSPSSSITATSNPKALVVLRKKNSRDSVFARNCKTLPRGGLIPQNLRFSIDSDVYGLYGNLINVRGLEDEGRFVDPLYDALRRSDPELVALDAKINTMDRRFKMRMSRPRSLDLSNWSVDSKISVSSDESGGASGGATSRLSGGSSTHAIEHQNNTAAPHATITRHSSDNALAGPSTGASSKSIDSTTEPVNNSTTSPLNNSTGTMSSRKTATRTKGNAKPASPSKSHQDKTMIVVTGGRGYINMKSQPLQDHYLQHTSSGSHLAESDSKQVTYISVWQMKT